MMMIKIKRLILLNHFIDIIPNNDKDISGREFNPQSGDTIKYRFLFFYDADTDEQKQLDKVNAYLSKIAITKTLKHNQTIEENDYSVGAYIFSNTDGTGSLEDTLLELMKQDNESIFEKAKKYYDDCFDKSKAKRLSTECNESIPKDSGKGKNQIDRNKSILAIAGQLQNKGKLNVVTIANSSYLTLEKITNLPQLQKIANFIEK